MTFFFNDSNILLVSVTLLCLGSDHIFQTVLTLVTVNGPDQTKVPSVSTFHRAILGPVLFALYTQPLFELLKEHLIQHHAFASTY